METYYTKVDVQADRYIVETEKPTIIVENEEMTEEEFIDECEARINHEYGVRSNHEYGVRSNHEYGVRSNHEYGVRSNHER